ncbi:hypothetical protein COBT_003394, partial [Conglomerata obtusa]
MDITEIDNREFAKDFHNDLTYMLNYVPENIHIDDLKALAIYFSLDSIPHTSHRKQIEYIHCFFQILTDTLYNETMLNNTNAVIICIYIMNYVFFSQHVFIKFYISIERLEAINKYLEDLIYCIEETKNFIIGCFDGLKINNAFLIYFNKDSALMEEKDVEILAEQIKNYEEKIAEYN